MLQRVVLLLCFLMHFQFISVCWIRQEKRELSYLVVRSFCFIIIYLGLITTLEISLSSF
jgi:hypothetical protein